MPVLEVSILFSTMDVAHTAVSIDDDIAGIQGVANWEDKLIVNIKSKSH